jgi:hypothetical protein
MDKIKALLSDSFGKLIGTSITSFVVRILIACIALYTGSATDLGDAVGQALDKDRSIAVAVELINDTPKSEIVEAVKEETE